VHSGEENLAITLPCARRALIASAHARRRAARREHIPHELKLMGASATRSGSRITLAFAPQLPERRAASNSSRSSRAASSVRAADAEGEPSTVRRADGRSQWPPTFAACAACWPRTGPDAGGWVGTIEVPLSGADPDRSAQPCSCTSQQRIQRAGGHLRVGVVHDPTTT